MADVRREVTPEQLVGERIGGRFVVERLIGHGPLSSVFLARDERLHRRVTVKLFHPRHPDDAAVVESQLELARAVARLSHEHIAMIIDRCEHEGLPLIVLEHVRGENLQQRLERCAPLAAEEVLAYGVMIARALAYAHSHGVVHGNLRPVNVLVPADQDIKVVDFGATSRMRQLVDGNPWLPPERVADESGSVEPADDVYALGSVLWHALTESTPRAGISAGHVRMERPDVAPAAAAAIAHALATDPEARPVDMRAFADELEAARGGREGRPLTTPVSGGAVGTAGEDTSAFDVVEDGGLEPDRPGDDAERPRRARGATSTVRRGRGDAGSEAPAHRRTARESRARVLAWSMLLVPLALLVLVGVMLAGEREEPTRERRTDERSAPPEPAAPPVAVDIRGASAFDPYGDGAIDDENAVRAASAIDGIGVDEASESYWTTSGYEGGLGDKPGVGLVLELARPADVRQALITTDLGGWKAQVYAAPAVPAGGARSLAGWKPVSKVVSVTPGIRIKVDLPAEPQGAYLLWITELALDPDDAERYRARVHEVQLRATPAG